MSEGTYLVPDEWTLPVAAWSIGVTVDELQRMIDAGEVELTVAGIASAAARRSMEGLATTVPPRRRGRARRS